MDETDFFEGDFADYPGDAADYEGDGPYTGGVPDDHWSQNPEWVTFADQFMQLLQNDPQAIEAWYGEFAAQSGLRGLAEAVAEAGGDPAGEPDLRKFTGLSDPELRDAAKEHMVRFHEQRKAARGR